MRKVALLLVVALVAACATAPGHSPLAESQIVQASDRVWEAHERGDASSLAALLTEDAILMVPGMPDVQGRGAIQSLAEGMFANLRISNFNVQRREIRIVGDLAYELAWYSETLEPKDGTASPSTGRYLIVWKRGNDGSWRVYRNLFNLASGTHP